MRLTTCIADITALPASFSQFLVAMAVAAMACHTSSASHNSERCACAVVRLTSYGRRGPPCKLRSAVQGGVAHFDISLSVSSIGTRRRQAPHRFTISSRQGQMQRSVRTVLGVFVYTLSKSRSVIQIPVGCAGKPCASCSVFGRPRTLRKYGYINQSVFYAGSMSLCPSMTHVSFQTGAVQCPSCKAGQCLVACRCGTAVAQAWA